MESIYPSNLYQWKIVLGAHNHYQPDNYVQTLSIRRVIKHPMYSKKTLMSDMAMIELSQAAKLNSRVTVACLPQQGVYPRTGKECFIAGMDSVLLKD